MTEMENGSPPSPPSPPPGSSGGSGASPGSPGDRPQGGAGHFFSTAASRSAGGAASAARWASPLIRQGGVGLTNWLATIGWGKFFLLSLLLLIFSNIASSIFFSKTQSHTERYRQGHIKVEVHIAPLKSGGVAIFPVDEGDLPVVEKDKSKKKMKEESGVIFQIDPDKGEKIPNVRIDKEGVRVLADDSGHKVSVVIDHNGVHVEEVPKEHHDGSMPVAPPAPPAPPPAPLPMPGGRLATPLPPVPSMPVPDDALIVPAEEAGDPAKVAMAVEAARDQIESILQQQVDDRLQSLSEDEGKEREDWMVALSMMTIVALIALKVVLGSKSKAELQARRASETAAEEGLKRQLAEAQIKMMQAQVEPHFLFNTLASVDYLIETDPARASRMQKNLIQYLRASLPQMREGTSTLGREILQCRSYLEILKVRMDERLQFSINVPQGLQSAAFPPMMLITLVENAIKHGLEPKAEGGSLSVSALVADGALRVAVADSGLGFGVAQRGGTGVGLANVRERLAALYGPAASLAIDANAQGGTIATIVVPYRIDAGAPAEGGGMLPAQPAPAV